MVTLSIYFLLTNPAYYHRLRSELTAAFPDPTHPLSTSTLADLPFLEGVLNETLRLTGHYFIPRIVPPGGIVIDGQHIPEGTIFALANRSQQTSPENFSPDPEVRAWSVLAFSSDCSITTVPAGFSTRTLAPCRARSRRQSEQNDAWVVLLRSVTSLQSSPAEELMFLVCRPTLLYRKTVRLHADEDGIGAPDARV